MTTIVTPKNTLHAPYAIQLDNSLSPETVVPCTPGGDGPSDYKQIDDDIVLGIATGYWSSDLFTSFDNLVPNALMVSLCPCVSLAQITSRLGLLPYRTALLIFAIICSLELLVVTLAVVQFFLVAVLGRNKHTRYYHSHRYNQRRSSINAMFIAVAMLTHATLIIALWLLRKWIRKQFQIPGSNSDDCLTVACCPCFATAQMATHIKSYQPGSCSFGPVDTLPRYQ